MEDTFIKEDRRKEERLPPLPIDRQQLEKELRSGDRNYELREPIDRHAHSDRRYRG